MKNKKSGTLASQVTVSDLFLGESPGNFSDPQSHFKLMCNRKVYTPKASCMKKTSGHLKPAL